MVKGKIESKNVQNSNSVKKLTPLNQFQKLDNNHEYSKSFEWIWEIMHNWAKNNYEKYADAAFFLAIPSNAWKNVITP